MNTVERTRHLLVFNHLVNQTEYHVRVHSLTKRTKINELPAEQLTKCSLNVWFVLALNTSGYFCTGQFIVRF
ncbi:hypothetical protein Hanom_Chr06g00502911 [Helianthus anomalus]